MNRIKLNTPNDKYVVITDSSCDLPSSYLSSEGIDSVNLYFYFNTDEKMMADSDMPSNIFYEKMRNGEIARTSAPDPEAFEVIFTKHLEKGEDILYLGFGSGLSATVSSARVAADTLIEKYPERKILILDSLCASAGQGLLVAMTKGKVNDGYSLTEAYEYAASLAPRISHRFTVDTLTYLCRGGRVSKTAAMAGNLLNIKPVLHMDDEGHLINIAKARGRLKSFSMLLDAYESTAVSQNKKSLVAAGAENICIDDDTDDDGMIMISHADCLEDAKKLESMIKTRFNKSVDMICNIGPVIGAHSGPGTIALFFVANER